MKKVIITGAGGFIGKSLVEYLLKKNICVVGIDINDNNLLDLKNNINFRFINASFENYDNLEKTINDTEFDIFYHFAWDGVFGTPFKDYALQLSNTKYACDAIKIAINLKCKKFVLAGTMNQFETLDYMTRADIEPRYTCIYATSKIAADMICKTIAFNEGIEFNSGLIAMAYGENNKSMMIPNVVMKSLNEGISPKLTEGKNLYDMMYIDDICYAFYCIGKSGINLKDYYIGHKKEDLRTFKEWMQEIRDIINPNVELKFGEYPEAAKFDYNKINTHELYDDTEFQIISDFHESIIKTKNWLKENKL